MLFRSTGLGACTLGASGIASVLAAVGGVFAAGRRAAIPAPALARLLISIAMILRPVFKHAELAERTRSFVIFDDEQKKLSVK